MSIKQTFWNLLDIYNIEIPIIQRDYAQGRNDAKSTQIRKNFIKSLHQMVVDPNRSQDLDFIYGSVKGDKLVLLDGQQRLTTLFLLHWYVAIGSGTIAECCGKLSKFDYQTRISSREFLSSLLHHSNDLVLPKNGDKLSASLMDAHWFFSVWRYDPTVQSMLTMLDEIHQVFKGSLDESENLWANLVSQDKPPITFHFLNILDFDLTDELYIKMNARGRPLSEFENFKAWLQQYSDKQALSDEVPKNFWYFLDKEWTDIFWSLRDKGVYEVDEMFLRTFKSIALSSVIDSFDVKVKKLREDSNSLVDSLRRNLYIPTAFYEKYECFTNQALSEVSRFFSFIHEMQTHKLEQVDSFSSPIIESKCEDLLKGILKENGYLEQVRFFALFFYITKADQSKKIDLEDLQDWLGVTSRLINNTSFDSSIDYVRAIRSLKSMKHLIGDCVVRLAKFVSTDISYFNKEQSEEEILKAKLVVSNISWKSLLHEYEEHEYFYGQIGFLLEGANKEGKYSREQFRSYASKASVLFSNDLIETNDFILQRSLLSVGDYLIESGSNYSFCKKLQSNARDRNENWRKVFNDKDRRRILFELLDLLEEGNEKEGLTKLVSLANCSDWRQHFIRYPEAIKYCRERQVRFDYYDGNDEIYLLYGIRMSGRHRGLRTFSLYQELDKSTDSVLDNLKVKMGDYYEVSGSEELPGIVFESWQGGNLQIEYRDGKFQIELYVNDADKIDLPDCEEVRSLNRIINELRSMELSES
ncbi:DUF262 domain-containing protein [Marinomonas sp. NPDC078689]|uniref:DUF262 domain-containing protein n=1 Tax=Marinomonas sp. NPDC078689 TaxID=3364147 RepID=UPI0037C59F82